MYKSQFREIDPYDWFRGPGLYIYICMYVYTVRQIGI